MSQIETLQQQLAESQAREAKLRKALKVVISFELSNACVGDTDDLCYEFRMAANALSVSPDDTALCEMVERAGEVAFDRVMTALANISPSESRIAVIRALPGVTLEDLK